MCGIAGLAGAGAADAGALERMAGEMVHRGPDGAGCWYDDDVGLAFRRLAIIDLHERSNQPLHRGDLHLVFNGEIYNYIELRQELVGAGHRFETEGDGEVLLHAWAEWGESALDRLNGMFALAIWDAGTRRLTLAVDRFAEKPLFFHPGPDRLMFASDVRALRAADADVGVPDERAANRFLAIGTMPILPATFFADVQRLPPAHLLRWRPGESASLHRWWTPQPVDVPRSPHEAAAALRELLRESVALRLRSDVPVGTSLSGGIDSSAVVGMVSELAGDHERHAFTATFPGFERDEWRYAEAVASSAGVVHHHAVLPTMDELLDDLPALVAAQEEPFGTTSIYAQYRVMRAAREAGVVVLLDGQGADELFGGYLGLEGWVLRSAGLGATGRALWRGRRNRLLLESAAVAYTEHRLPARLARWYRARGASPYLDPASVDGALDRDSAAPDWVGGGTPLHRQLRNMAFRVSLPDLCRFADRDSMAFSIEVRLPFLDPRVAEFALSLPPELLWREGVTKRALRDAVRGLAPDLVIDRRDKVGYETPQHRWFGSDSGRARLAEIVLEGTAAGSLARSEIERDLTTGTWRDTDAIWRAVNVELWLADWRARAGAGTR